MELQPSWVDYTYAQIPCEHQLNANALCDSYPEILNDEDDGHSCVCINSILPDDILEQILMHLSFATIIKGGCVCKKWNDIIHSDRFIRSLSSISTEKPWYFMFTRDREPYGYVYDPMLSKWYTFDIPYTKDSSWNLVSCSGLVCFMENECTRNLYICNPMTRNCRKLLKPRGSEVSDYCSYAISIDESSLNYNVAIVKSKLAPGELGEWDLSIHLYSSENKTWVSLLEVTLEAWRSGVDSTICDGVLYFVVYLTRMLGYVRPRFGVLAYDLSSNSFDLSVDDQVVSAPCQLSCMRLVNLDEELIMIGGIERKTRPGLVKGIGIWILRQRNWEEVSRMPTEFFRGFGEFDDTFECSGFDKLIYIQSWSPTLLMFNMSSKEWKWARKCNAVKKSSPLQIFSGVCFKPRLDIVP